MQVERSLSIGGGSGGGGGGGGGRLQNSPRRDRAGVMSSTLACQNHHVLGTSQGGLKLSKHVGFRVPACTLALHRVLNNLSITCSAICTPWIGWGAHVQRPCRAPS